MRRRERGRCPEVGAGRGSPCERLEARSALARAPAAGLGGGAGTRAAGFSAVGTGGVGPWRPVGGFCAGKVSGSLDLSVTQFSNFWLSGVEAGASGPAFLQGAWSWRPGVAPGGARPLRGLRGERFRGFL